MQYVFLFCFLFVTSLNAQNVDLKPFLILNINNINAKGGSISVTEIQKAMAFHLVYKKNSSYKNCVVESFEISAIAKRTDWGTVINQGIKWNDNVLDFFKKAIPTQAIYINQIRAKCNDNEEVIELDPVVFNVIK